MPEYTVSLTKKTRIAHNVLELECTRPADFAYQAGQFVQFIITDGDKTVPRAYSLCSTVSDTYLQFCIKLIPGGKASCMFDALQVGESASIRGPHGNFVSKDNNPLYCVATGAGLAPIMGIIEDELKNKKTDKQIYLLFGVREEGDVFWQKRLESLRTTYSNFSFHITLSQPQTSVHHCLSGRVTAHMTHCPSDHSFFICGNPYMVKDVRDTLLEKNIDKKNIHFEIF